VATNHDDERVALAAADSFCSQLLADLDTEFGGFKSWQGHLDQRRVILIADYLISVARQVRQGLEACAVHRANLSDKWTSHSFNLQRRLKAQTGSSDSFLWLNESERKRMVEIDNEIKGFFVESGTLLDSLGAAFVGVAAIQRPIVESSWTAVEKAPNWLGQRSKFLEDPGTSGRSIQEDVIQNLQSVIPDASSDWLNWTLDMRNALVHRGIRMKFTHLYGDRQRGIKFAYWLPRNPKFSDAEAFARGNNPVDIYIQEHAGDVVNLVWQNMQHLVQGFISALSELWARRVGNPTTLVQPGQQWPSLELTEARSFVGTGSGKSVKVEGSVRVNPTDALRFQAAQLLDADNSIWRELKVVPKKAP
jgi:hypothetical protein